MSTSTNIEYFRPIKNYEGIYEVSNLGRVKSISKGKILKQSNQSAGYLSVRLSKKGKSETKTIHQLVAIAFLDHKPNGHSLIVDHINNIKSDNRLENLQIITNRENSSKDLINSKSKYVGVCWNKSRGKWLSRIQINGQRVNLGSFKSEIDAHNAYELALKNLD